MRCTNYTLKAFGIEVAHEVKTDLEICKILRANGFYTGSYVDYLDYMEEPIGKFITDHPTGSFVLGTSQHSMALIDGKLYDTASGGMRRKLCIVTPISREPIAAQTGTIKIILS